MQKHELLVLLADNGIDINLWGTGNAKSLDDLWKEIVEGESLLEVIGDELIRKTCVVSLIVKYGDLILVEDRQVFPDGRVRRRTLGSSLGEKLCLGENPADGAKRALREELQITEILPLTYTGEETKGPEESMSYPGLKTLYVFSNFTVVLPDHLFKKEYVEVSSNGKRTYFVWK